MPTYEYRCKGCGRELEVVQSFSDASLTVCPHCGGPLRKVFGSIGITFKGDGFYKNDSRSSQQEEQQQEQRRLELELRRSQPLPRPQPRWPLALPRRLGPVDFAVHVLDELVHPEFVQLRSSSSGSSSGSSD